MSRIGHIIRGIAATARISFVLRQAWLIILPLLGPILFVGAVILMVSVWNDFFFALFLLQGSERATLPLTLYRFAAASEYTLRWNLVFAHVVLTSLPLIVVYIFLQKKVVQGVTEGSVKG